MSALAKRTPSPPTIRPATDADVLAMAKVHIVSWRETYPGMLPEPMLARMSIANEAIRWQRMLDRPRAGTIAFVAEQDAEIGELYVLRSAQRQCAGTGLMRGMAGALVERGHRAMSLCVLGENADARRFYERLGGVPVAEKRAGLFEVAYGWSDLRVLLSSRAD
jgi:ribosomal protein S18 acetylase RimI-like enzyme